MPLPAPPPETVTDLYLHVRVLLGMVMGLGLTHLLRNFARIIERPRHKPVYAVHLLWATYLFVYLLHFWWWEFRLAGVRQWTFELYLFVTLYALLLYLLCALAFPEDLSDYPTWRDYYDSRRRWFFGLLTLACGFDLADTWLKGAGYFRSFGPELYLYSGAMMAGCAIAMATRNRAYHAAFVVAALLYRLSWIVRQYDTLL
ncbi:hypothetical protein JR065_00590 [Xanthomonas sp. AmX2]|uniref:hypothetical protein n=1 Tax=Xanthomonas sp. TaxID=29446 RepID=UPI00197CD30B|nr:hypothetical protein [Xanthomonas sp.]MBN6148823.1 hypothetical protein [Xanthomonas sp.]